MKHKITLADVLKLAAVALTVGIIYFIRYYPILYPPPVDEKTLGGLLQDMSQDGHPPPDRSDEVILVSLAIVGRMVFYSVPTAIGLYRKNSKTVIIIAVTIVTILIYQSLIGWLIGFVLAVWKSDKKSDTPTA
jgi:hypothetical protein